MNRVPQPLDDRALDILFREARTYNSWQDKPVGEAELRALYELLKYGPTEANSCPARFVFILNDEAKQRLKPLMSPGNVDKTMSAPVTVLIALDLDFYEQMPKLFPHADAKSWYAGKPDVIREVAMRNAVLQGAYLMMAARAVGLDCGPMIGFDKAGVKDAFFAGKNWEAGFMCNLGYGTGDKLFPRLPRFDFDEVCEIL